MDFAKIITELGIDKLPEDQQQGATEDAFRAVQSRVSLRLSAELTEEQMQGIEEAAKKSPEAAEAEMDRVYPNLEAMYQEEIDKFIADMKS